MGTIYKLEKNLSDTWDEGVLQPGDVPEDTTHMTVTDAEKITWNGKLDAANLGTVNEVYHGNPSGAGTFSAVVEADISLSANTTNNTQVGTHGFAPALSGVNTQFLRGDGAWASPASVSAPNAYAEESFAYTSGSPHTIVHNFGARPLVQAINSSGNVVAPTTIHHEDLDTVIITMGATETFDVILTMGSLPLENYVSTSADYNMVSDESWIEVTAEDKTVTLLTPVGRLGKKVTITNSSIGGAYAGTAAAHFSIAGVTYDTITIPSGNSYDFKSNNTNWIPQ